MDFEVVRLGEKSVVFTSCEATNLWPLLTEECREFVLGIPIAFLHPFPVGDEATPERISSARWDRTTRWSKSLLAVYKHVEWRAAQRVPVLRQQFASLESALILLGPVEIRG